MNDQNATIESVKDFAFRWNEMFLARDFEAMKELATADVQIANSSSPNANVAGMIVGREAYYQGIYNASQGSGGEENVLQMDFENWEYISVGDDEHMFYTIGKYSLYPAKNPEKKSIGVNCWLLKRENPEAPWQVYRVINT